MKAKSTVNLKPLVVNVNANVNALGGYWRDSYQRRGGPTFYDVFPELPSLKLDGTVVYSFTVSTTTGNGVTWHTRRTSHLICQDEAGKLIWGHAPNTCYVAKFLGPEKKCVCWTKLPGSNNGSLQCFVWTKLE